MRNLILLSAFVLLRQMPLCAQISGDSSQLTLPQALQTAMANFALLRAKQNYANASAQEVKAAKQDGLPDFILEAENAYGTLDGLNGLSSGQPGLTTLTSGPVTATQNWNAAFGALYVTNINWNIFSFGLQRAHVAAASGQHRQDLEDLKQEQFQQQVRVAGAYLSLLAAERVRMAMEDNLKRASQLRDVILRRTENGLNPGVDSSIANAEVSRARLSLIDAKNYEEGQEKELSIQMGIAPRSFRLDTSFSLRLPGDVVDRGGTVDRGDGIDRGGMVERGDGMDKGEVPVALSANPTLQFLDSRVKTSDLLATYIHKTGLPRLSLFGVGQDRGSGYGTNYATDQSDYSTGLFQGIGPSRVNYLVGIGLSWNITDFGRSRSRMTAQHFRSSALRDEYDLEQNKLTNQLTLADQQIGNALAKYNETPLQLKSAIEAYGQKKALYETGLNNIVDVSQTLYILNRAEIDRDIACNAVWQALLFKAGTLGNLNLFLQQL
jgi:outer membrane protein TolC